MTWLDTFLQDLRHCGRLLLKNPGFSAVGMVAGVFLSVVTARPMVTVVQTTATLRPVLMLIIVPVLVSVPLLAAFVPARRAAKTDPTVALRYE